MSELFLEHRGDYDMENELVNLGELEGEVWVFGGPYSNFQALESLKSAASERGIPETNILCTGDTVAYCGQPEETVLSLRSWGIPVLMGNCEESLADEADDCGCGFDEGSSCSVLSVSWYRYAQSKLSAASKVWMGGLPTDIRFTLAGKHIALTHGSPEKINEFVFASTPPERKRDLLDRSGADILIAGHTGIPFGQAVNGRYWLNAGTIGMPANDGQSDVWYMVLSPSSKGIKVTWRRLKYDYRSAQLQMRDASLPAEYTEALASGIWPSMDVLPPDEQKLRGKEICLPGLWIS